MKSPRKRNFKAGKILIGHTARKSEDYGWTAKELQ